MRLARPAHLLSLSCVLLAACSGVQVHSKRYLGVPTYPPSDPAQVEILHSEPTRPHVRLGEVTLEPQGNPPTATMENALRERAAELGADAVVLVADRTQVMGAVVLGPWWAPTQEPIYGRVIVAVAIKFTDH